MINPVENKSIYKKIINKKKYVKHLLSSIGFIKKILGYNPNVSFGNGLNRIKDCFTSK